MLKMSCKFGCIVLYGSSEELYSKLCRLTTSVDLLVCVRAAQQVSPFCGPQFALVGGRQRTERLA